MDKLYVLGINAVGTINAKRVNQPVLDEKSKTSMNPCFEENRPLHEKISLSGKASPIQFVSNYHCLEVVEVKQNQNYSCYRKKMISVLE